MTFRDLPENWNLNPLSASGLAADVVDLVMGERDRVADSLAVIVCDAEHRIAGNPIMVDETHWRCSNADRHLYVGSILEALSAPAVLVAAGTRTDLPADLARAWRETLVAQCRRTGTTLLGFYVCALDTVTEVRPTRPSGESFFA
ncbi:hypothetical protein ACFQ23_01870 [Schaalia naturae]|uniref:Uncharacterized protein n=1 Tax=Schaalia naturae TaxID=635203 RepID=A0ABW2SNN4_9ACTO